MEGERRGTESRTKWTWRRFWWKDQRGEEYDGQNKYRFGRGPYKGAYSDNSCHSGCKCRQYNFLASHWFWFRSSHWCLNGTYWRCLLNRDIANKRTCACNQSNWNQYLARQRGEGKGKSWVWDISSQSLNTWGKRQGRKLCREINWEREKPSQLCFTSISASGQSCKLRWPLHQKWPSSQYGSI